jgi:hypothetical protein
MVSIIFVAVSVFLMSFPVHPTYAQNKINVPSCQNGDRWQFSAAIEGSIANSSNMLGGDYELLYESNSIQVFTMENGSRSSPAPEQPAEQLKRMLACGQDERAYLKFPMAVGMKWDLHYEEKVPGGRRLTGVAMTYEVKEITKEITSDVNIAQIIAVGQMQTPERIVSTKAEYRYREDSKCIVEFRYDSAVGEMGAKTTIKMIKYTPAK